VLQVEYSGNVDDKAVVVHSTSVSLIVKTIVVDSE
jgi:hypothetical protein